MRRPLLILLVAALALPAAAVAARHAPGDGTLIVRNASGKVTIQGRGLIYGYLERGTLTVLGYEPDGLTLPSVSGARMLPGRGRANVVYSGAHVRFLFPGGEYTLRLDGLGIDVSAVGAGFVHATGVGLAQGIGLGTTAVSPRGTISVNGSRPLVIGIDPLALTFGPRVPFATSGARIGRP